MFLLSPNPPLDTILEAAASGRRISPNDALRLAASASLADLALAADCRRNQLHPGRRVSYIVERNINYTNVCNVYCRFCAFYRAPGRPGGYTLSRDELAAKIEETVAAGGIQILLQGGLNPELGIDYYVDLFRWIKANYAVNLHALSADEILHVGRVSGLSIRAVLARLKSTSEEWLEVHRTAHRLGINSTCTMMFGVRESWSDRLLHLEKLRRLQDETGGFTAFITWPYQQGQLAMPKGNTSAAEYLRVQAVARLLLDNIPHLQSSWVTQGPSIGQIALDFGADDFGADDFGAVMFEENVVSAAGTTYRMNAQLIETHLRRAGYVPWRRDVHYQAADEGIRDKG
jgi:cyclic dehypoxanthinyl futalosine synthase